MSWRVVISTVLMAAGLLLVLLGASVAVPPRTDPQRARVPSSVVLGVVVLSAAVGVIAIGQHRVGRGSGRSANRDREERS